MLEESTRLELLKLAIMKSATAPDFKEQLANNYALFYTTIEDTLHTDEDDSVSGKTRKKRIDKPEIFSTR